MTAPLLATETLSRAFGALSALSRVSLEVAARERRAIIGPNGAGKTTLFNVITASSPPRRPHPPRRRTDRRAGPARGGPARHLALVQAQQPLPKLAVRRTWAGRRGGRAALGLLGSVTRRRGPLDRAREVAEVVGLSDRLGEPAGRLSYGEQRQLEIGVALATSPRLLLLDEPTAGMSPEETQRMTRMLEALPRDITLLIIEHDMDVVGSLADRVTVLHYGEVLTEGTFAQVKADPRVYEVYLGSA